MKKIIVIIVALLLLAGSYMFLFGNIDPHSYAPIHAYLDTSELTVFEKENEPARIQLVRQSTTEIDDSRHRITYVYLIDNSFEVVLDTQIESGEVYLSYRAYVKGDRTVAMSIEIPEHGINQTLTQDELNSVLTHNLAEMQGVQPMTRFELIREENWLFFVIMIALVNLFMWAYVIAVFRTKKDKNKKKDEDLDDDVIEDKKSKSRGKHQGIKKRKPRKDKKEELEEENDDELDLNSSEDLDDDFEDEFENPSSSLRSIQDILKDVEKEDEDLSSLDEDDFEDEDTEEDDLMIKLPLDLRSEELDEETEKQDESKEIKQSDSKDSEKLIEEEFNPEKATKEELIAMYNQMKTGVIDSQKIREIADNNKSTLVVEDTPQKKEQLKKDDELNQAKEKINNKLDNSQSLVSILEEISEDDDLIEEDSILAQLRKPEFDSENNKLLTSKEKLNLITGEPGPSKRSRSIYNEEELAAWEQTMKKLDEISETEVEAPSQKFFIDEEDNIINDTINLKDANESLNETKSIEKEVLPVLQQKINEDRESTINQLSVQQTPVQTQSSANEWECSCEAKNVGKFCQECGKPKVEEWKCLCGIVNSGKFCQECGKPKGNQNNRPKKKKKKKKPNNQNRN